MLPSLVYVSFELDIEQDEIRKTLLIHKQKTEWIEWFCSFLLDYSWYFRQGGV